MKKDEIPTENSGLCVRMVTNVSKKIEKWALEQMEKTGETESAFLRRLMHEAKSSAEEEPHG